MKTEREYKTKIQNIMKFKTFIIMGFISTSCLGGCAQRPGPLGERQSNSTISISLPPLRTFFPTAI